MWLSLLAGGLAVLVPLVALLHARYRAQRLDLSKGRRTLIVTAHPDDECMFFAPVILSLTSGRGYKGRAAQVYLLCLSEGDFYGEGAVRRRELQHAAAVLGIPKSNVEIINDRELPDHPTLHWNVTLVEDYINQAMSKHDIDRVITFDGEGVSGHANHVAVSQAARNLITLQKIKDVELLLLETTSVWRKYCGWVDVIYTVVMTNRKCVVSGPTSWLVALRALRQHSSQMVWFRWLYMTFSRYMILNTFKLHKDTPTNHTHSK